MTDAPAGPDARKLEDALDAFVRACLDVFGEERVRAVVLHGSAAKGGLIPEFSDLDLAVFLSSDCVDEFGLRLDYAFAMQERIAALDWEELSIYYPQAYFYDAENLPDWWTGPVPGSYRLLWGELPPQVAATEERLLDKSLHFLRRDLPARISTRLHSFADALDDELPRKLRLLSTDVTPALFSLASLEADDVLAVWSLTKLEAAELVERRYRGREEATIPRRFYGNVRHLYGEGFEVPLARTTYRMGLDFLIWAHRQAAQRSVAEDDPA